MPKQEFVYEVEFVNGRLYTVYGATNVVNMAGHINIETEDGGYVSFREDMVAIIRKYAAKNV